MKENIQAVFVYIAANFLILNETVGKGSNIQKFQIRINFFPISTSSHSF